MRDPRRPAPRPFAALVRAASVVTVALGVLASGPHAAFAGTASASARGVDPVVAAAGGTDSAGECAALTDRRDLASLRVPGEADGFPDGSPYAGGTLEVAIANWDPSARSFDWSSNLPVVGVWVDGDGAEGNWYDYETFTDQAPASGADHDGALRTEEVSGSPAPLSHVTFCYERPAPGLAVTQSSSAPAPLRRGDTYTYAATVTNGGTAAAKGVHLHDQIPIGLHVIHLLPTFDGGSCTVASSIDSRGWQRDTVDCTRRSLEAGASATASIDVEVAADVPCGALTNLVTVEAANDPAGGSGGAQRASLTDRLPCVPSIAVEEHAPSYARQGQTVALTFRVTNDGETPLAHLSVRTGACDARPHRVSGGNGDAVLAPGEHWLFGCRGTVRAPSGTTRPGVSVRAAGPHGRVVSATAHTRVRVVHPAIGLITSVSPTAAAPGASVVVRYAVTNRGDTPLRHVRVVDPAAGVVGTAARLAPGATRVFERTVVLTAAGTSSVAHATARDVTGRRLSDAATTSVTAVAFTGPGADGTAFTGTDVGRPLLAAVVLALLGLAAEIVARPRRLS
ncbi:MAG: hypothetical protein ACM3OO_02730 [Planctomycetaceae bacterium]